MSNLKLLRTILRLKSLKVTHVRFMHRDTELHLAVKPYKNGCRCPACGRRGRIVHQTSERRRWEDVAVMGLRIVLWYAPKEIQCPTHGRVQEEIPWAPAYARVTYRLEWRLCALCQIMTQQAAAEILRLPTSTLSNLLHRVITRVLSLALLKLSGDSVHDYATISDDSPSPSCASRARSAATS